MFFIIDIKLRVFLLLESSKAPLLWKPEGFAISNNKKIIHHTAKGLGLGKIKTGQVTLKTEVHLLCQNILSQVKNKHIGTKKG